MFRIICFMSFQRIDTLHYQYSVSYGKGHVCERLWSVFPESLSAKEEIVERNSYAVPVFIIVCGFPLISSHRKLLLQVKFFLRTEQR